MAVLALCGPAACNPRPGASPGGEGAQTIALGNDAAGEPCRAVARRPARRAGAAPPAYDIFCGPWTRPSGNIVVVPSPAIGPADAGVRRAAVERIARDHPSAQDRALRMDCKSPTWADEAGAPAHALSECTLKAGQWPYAVILAERDTRLFIAEGVPALAPVILMAIGDGFDRAAAARGASTTADRSAVIRQLESSLSSSAVGAGDLAQYEDFLELARLYDSEENFAGAEAAYRRALAIQTRALGSEAPGVGETLATLALAVSNQGRVDEADLLFQRAGPLVQRSVDPTDFPRFQSYLAFHAANQGQFVNGLGLMRDATRRRRELAEQFGGADDAPDPGGLGGSGRTILGSAIAVRSDLAHGLIFEAAMALRVDDIAGAEAAANEARRILDNARGLPPWWRSRLLSVSGDIDARLGRSGRAEAAFREDLALRRRLFATGWPVAEGYFALGRFYAGEARYPDAIGIYRSGFQTLAAEPASGAEIRVATLAPFFDAALIAADRDPAARAGLYGEMFVANQLIRGGVAGQAVSRTAARLATADPRVAELTRNLDQARRERDSLNLQLADETAKPRDQRDAAFETDLRTRLDRAMKSAAELESQVQSAFPAYARLAAPGPVDAPTVMQRLQESEALVTFALARDAGYAFLIRPGRVTAARLEIGEPSVTEMVGELRRAFEAQGGRTGPYDLDTAHTLYRQLLGPLEGELVDVKHLIVVPGGALASLPPGLLVTEAPRGDRNYGRAAWLARRMSTSFAPSIRAFVDLRESAGRASAPRGFIGFGAPALDGSSSSAGSRAAMDALARDCRTASPIAPELLRALTPLPETADELRRVGALFGASAQDIVLGRNASEAEVLRRPLDQYRVIYFATHGLLPGELRCQAEPALVLSPPEPGTPNAGDDGLLEASAVAMLHLSADLVVLSACNTGGAGGKLGGEALSGLAEAFFYAGARSLLVSHWQVPSASTARLMTDLFARAAASGQSVAESLRQAQLALVNVPETSHPYFWGAFTLVGDHAVTAIDRNRADRDNQATGRGGA